MRDPELRETIKALRAIIIGLERELEEQNKRYEQALKYMQREIRKAIYTPKKTKMEFRF